MARDGRLGQARDDPGAWWGTVVTVVATGMALAVAFGAPLTADQQGAVTAFLTALSTSVTAWLIRREAWRPSEVARTVARAAATGQIPPDTPPSDASG